MAGRRRLAVGILGGSFNPAHEGHLHISRLALRCLRLDRLWWLVSPQNPLKPKAGMAAAGARLANARAASAGERRIVVTDIEARLGTRYTADTLKALKRRFPRIRFVWIMGADNLAQVPRWQDWTAIFRTMPVAVFDRPSYSLIALAGKAARRYARRRALPGARSGLARRKPPAWAFFHGRLNPLSATQLRQARVKDRTGGRMKRTEDRS